MRENSHFETILNNRKSELEARLRHVEAELEEPMSSDISERAIGIEGGEVLEGIGQAGAAELMAIKAALGRLEKGTFGVCVRCGGDISEARLNAVPHAAVCEQCIRTK